MGEPVQSITGTARARKRVLRSFMVDVVSRRKAMGAVGVVECMYVRRWRSEEVKNYENLD